MAAISAAESVAHGQMIKVVCATTGAADSAQIIGSASVPAAYAGGALFVAAVLFLRRDA